MPQWRMAEPVNFESCNGEHIAIVGPNAGGKTRLVNIITGRYPLLRRDAEYNFYPSTKPMAADNIKYITFLDAYGGDSDRTYFLQQGDRRGHAYRRRQARGGLPPPRRGHVGAPKPAAQAV